MRAFFAIALCIMLGACAHSPTTNFPAGVGKVSVKKVDHRRRGVKPTPVRQARKRHLLLGLGQDASLLGSRHHARYYHCADLFRISISRSSKPARDTLPSANTATLQPVFYATNREITDGEKPLVERITYYRSRT